MDLCATGRIVVRFLRHNSTIPTSRCDAESRIIRVTSIAFRQTFSVSRPVQRRSRHGCSHGEEDSLVDGSRSANNSNRASLTCSCRQRFRYQAEQGVAYDPAYPTETRTTPRRAALLVPVERFSVESIARGLRVAVSIPCGPRAVADLVRFASSSLSLDSTPFKVAVRSNPSQALQRTSAVSYSTPRELR
jgi:hypothetical protein